MAADRGNVQRHALTTRTLEFSAGGEEVYQRGSVHVFRRAGVETRRFTELRADFGNQILLRERASSVRDHVHHLMAMNALGFHAHEASRREGKDNRKSFTSR